MAKRIFRHNEADFGTSPEQLQDYIRVTNPFVWMVLVSVILLLAGGIVASIFGKVEVTLNASARVETGIAYIDVATPDAYKLEKGMTVRFTAEKQEAKIENIVWLNDNQIAEASFTVDLPDAISYTCVVVTDVVSPIDFLIG